MPRTSNEGARDSLNAAIARDVRVTIVVDRAVRNRRLLAAATRLSIALVTVAVRVLLLLLVERVDFVLGHARRNVAPLDLQRIQQRVREMRCVTSRDNQPRSQLGDSQPGGFQ